MSHLLEQPVLKPEIQKFVQESGTDEWRKLNTDQRYQILHALQRFGILSDIDFIGLNWLLEAKALDVLSEKHLKEKIDSIRRTVQQKTASNLPEIPDLVIKKPAPITSLAKLQERMVDPNEMAERFKKFGINLFGKRLEWGSYYLHTKYWHPGEEKTLHIPSISESSMQQFEDALKNRVIDTVAFNDRRLGDGQALHRLTDLNNPHFIKELDQSANADASKLRQLILINEPHHQATLITKRDKKFLRKAKKDTEQYVIRQINEERKQRGRSPNKVQLIGFSVGGGEQPNIQNFSTKLTKPGWTGMDIGTINRILAFLSETDPAAAQAFVAINGEAHFANNFTQDGKAIGFEFCQIADDNSFIATPKRYGSIFTTNNHAPYIPMLVGTPGCT
ncbi:hypothetical protein IT413_00195 [Candidatus Peregrinibacteria bacterium]|nr:hypothetical protein [Candidatus Peregrinibacteria bacterium]